MKKTFFISFISISLLLSFLFWLNTPFRFLWEGETYLKRDKVAKAVKILEEGVIKFPDNQDLTYALAKAYLKLDDVENANKTVINNNLHKYLIKDECFRDYLAQLADANCRCGNKKISKVFALHYLNNEEKNNISKRLITNYILIGNVLEERSIEIWEKAYKIAEALKEKELKESLIGLLIPRYLEKAERFKSNKQYDGAITILNQAEKVGKHPEIIFLKGKIYSELKRYELANESFDEAIDLDPNNEDYKITYAESLNSASDETEDELQKKEYNEKIKLLLASTSNTARKTNVLNKIINLNSKYKITNTSLTVNSVGEYSYPTFQFKITPASEYVIKTYKVVFSNDNETIDTYESEVMENELNDLIKVTCKNPIEHNKLLSAKFYVNDDLVKEYTK